MKSLKHAAMDMLVVKAFKAKDLSLTEYMQKPIEEIMELDIFCIEVRNHLAYMIRRNRPSTVEAVVDQMDAIQEEASKETADVKDYDPDAEVKELANSYKEPVKVEEVCDVTAYSIEELKLSVAGLKGKTYNALLKAAKDELTAGAFDVEELSTIVKAEVAKRKAK